MISYEQVVSMWRSDTHPDVFSGRLLYLMASESAQIENINIDYHTTKELFETSFISEYTGDLRDLFSTMNNRQLADFYNRSLETGQKVTPWFIKESHKILLRGSIDKHRYHDNGERAGEYKRHDYAVGRNDVGSFPEHVEDDINWLCNFLESKSASDTLKRATFLHCLFERIHPFSDGNGRVGRWLMNYMLVSENHPPIVIFRADREEYYKALEIADTDDLEPMRKFLEEQTVKTWMVLV